MAVENAPQKPELDEVASLERDDQAIFNGFLNTLENPDKVLRLECGGDITVYDDIGRDSRVGTSLRTRAMAVVGKEWDVTPASDEALDMKIADYVKQVFLSFPFDRSRRGSLRGGVLKGFAVSEIMWDHSEGDTFISDMKVRAQRRFRYHIDSSLHLLTADNPIEGINLTANHPRKFQRYVFGDEVETPYGEGLGRELYWLWWFKKNGIKFWLKFCEKHAVPSIVGSYPRGADEAQKATLMAAMENIRNGALVTKPEGMLIDLFEAASTGAISTQRELVSYMDTEMTICILGQSGTTQGTPGKLGNDTAQENVREDLVKADADAMSEQLNAQAVRWLVDYQFPGHGRYPQLWIRAGAEADLKEKSEVDKNLKEVGVRFKKKYFVGTYGLDEDDFDVVDTTTGEVAEFSEQATPGQDALDELADQLSVQASNALADNEALILKAITTADTWEDAFDNLLELYPDLDASDLQDLLERGWLAAQLGGRQAVTEDVL
ncbi:DUF935 family protein [uncultured Desulfuromonas sp.]|uniref:DUF935 domain-containing protein n=1 Tax=uncultured Desulfuromonas sp. TaxID=181013 RepID=UPI002AAA7DA6|nr:DUF935 family protein [uncultured Desulfuromonas sp.]